ncbi:MAG: hypothetical protein MJ237_04715 [bacterium]|nr:hypothetical protein [bacterium]
METQLSNGLTFLAYATGAMVVIVGCMLTVVLFNLSKLTKNINETTTIVKTEIEPTLKNINKSVEIISSVVIKADEGIQNIKNFVSKTPFKIVGQLSKLTGKAAKGFFSGLITAFKTFSKK